MLKKAAIGLGVLFVVGGLVFGVSNMISMLKVGGNRISEYAHDQVPISAKIELLEQKLKELGPKIEDGKRVVATQEVRVDNLGRDIQDTLAALDKQWETIIAMRQDLDKGDTQYVYAGQTYTKDEVKGDLEKRFGRYKAAKEAADQQQELLKVRNRVLKANQEALANLQDSEARLNIMIEKLRARQETIKAKQIENLQTVDDSPTGDVMKLYEEIEEELSVQERLIEMEGDDIGEIQINKEAESKSLLEEIDAINAKKALGGEKELINTEVH